MLISHFFLFLSFLILLSPLWFSCGLRFYNIQLKIITSYPQIIYNFTYKKLIPAYYHFPLLSFVIWYGTFITTCYNPLPNTVIFALNSQLFLSLLNILKVRKTFSYIYLHIYHFCALCVDPSFIFLPPEKCPWTFLIIPICWQWVYTVFVYLKKSLLSFHSQKIFFLYIGSLGWYVYFSFSILNVFPLLSGLVCDKKSMLFLILSLLYTMCLLCLAGFIYFLCHSLFSLFYLIFMWLGVIFLCVSHAWSFLSFLSFSVYNILQILNKFCH